MIINPKSLLRSVETFSSDLQQQELVIEVSAELDYPVHGFDDSSLTVCEFC